MDIKEAYKVMQAQWVIDNDIEVGDKVKILRAIKTNELGSCGGRGDYANKIGKIGCIADNYIDMTTYGFFPFFTLELVEKKKEEKMITVKGKEYSEDTLHKALQAYVK